MKASDPAIPMLADLRFPGAKIHERAYVDVSVRIGGGSRVWHFVRIVRDCEIGKGYSIDLGIGLHTGYATCGFIGYEGRRDYGVIGNVTNIAARLSDTAKGGEILISARVRSELPASILTEPAGELSLKGFSEPQSAFRVLSAEVERRAREGS